MKCKRSSSTSETWHPLKKTKSKVIIQERERKCRIRNYLRWHEKNGTLSMCPWNGIAWMNDIESQMDWVRVANGKYQSLVYHPQFQIMNSIWGGSLETIHSSPETMRKCKILSRFSSKSEFYDYQNLSIFDSIPQISSFG